MYLAGVLVFGALIAGLVYWKLLRPAPAPPAAPAATAPAVTAPAEPPPLHALPPPPPIEEEPDAGADAGKAPTSGGATAAGKGPCSKCGEGEPSAAMASAINAAAGSARGCYNRALRTSEASGKMTVSVQVGSTGAVCNAAITSDTVGSGEIASCVLGRFRGKTFPPPKSGCVVVNVPINFTIKQ